MNAPTATGGAVFGYTVEGPSRAATGREHAPPFAVSPALPAGLALDAATGAITGTPSAAASAAVYTVTATNNGGSGAFELTLEIAAAPASPSLDSYSTAAAVYYITEAIPTIAPTVTCR